MATLNPAAGMASDESEDDDNLDGAAQPPAIGGVPNDDDAFQGSAVPPPPPAAGAAAAAPPPAALPSISLGVLPESILVDVLGRLALPDVILIGGVCCALRDASQAVHDAVRANADSHQLPVAMALGQFTKPALTRALVSPVSNYMSPQEGPCRWRDPSYVYVYIGTVLLGAPRLEVWSYASLQRSAVVGRLVHEVLAAALPQLRGGRGTAGLTTASGLSAVATALLGSPLEADTDFSHCVLGLRACLWHLREQPLEAAAGLEAVRRVCRAWPLSPLEGTKEGARARRRAVEWLHVTDTVANLIMRGWPAHTAAVAIASAHTPTSSNEPAPEQQRRADPDASDESLSDNSPSEGEDSDSDGSDAGFYPDDEGLMYVGQGHRRAAVVGQRQRLRRGASGSDLSEVAGTLWTWRWSQAPSAVASVVASACTPVTYTRPEGWAAEFVGVLLRVLVWPAVNIARPQNLATVSTGGEVVKFLFQITISMGWDLETLLQTFSFLLEALPSPPGVSPLAPNSPWRGGGVLALGVREAMAHRSLLASMARADKRSDPPSLTVAGLKLGLLQAIVEDSMMRGEARAAAAVLYHAMACQEEQSRAGAEE